MSRFCVYPINLQRYMRVNKKNFFPNRLTHNQTKRACKKNQIKLHRESKQFSLKNSKVKTLSIHKPFLLPIPVSILFFLFFISFLDLRRSPAEKAVRYLLKQSNEIRTWMSVRASKFKQFNYANLGQQRVRLFPFFFGTRPLAIVSQNYSALGI